MFKKIIIIIIIILMGGSIVFANNNTEFKSIISNAKIFYNGDEVKFNSPIVVINNQTYIPLKEAAEKANIKVEWNGEEKKIMLSDNSKNNESYSYFENFIGFKLPDSAEILNYDYYIENDDNKFVAKISFDEKDFDYIKNGFLNHKWLEITSSFQPLIYYHNKYSWWDLTDVNDTICAYQTLRVGSKSNTITDCFFITKGTNGEDYLYVAY